MSNYAFSNGMSNWNFASNVASYASNTLSNYAFSNGMSNWNFASNVASYASNTLSNYAFSNGMSNWNFASNLSVWASNNFSNMCPLWSFDSNDPLPSSNLGVLPRFIYNSNNDKTYFVDCLGVSVPLQGYGPPVEPNVSAIISFLTTTELAAIAEPEVGDAYIITTGDPMKTSDIATWDGEEWQYYSPSDAEIATVTTASGTYLVGTYTYIASTDLWTFTSSGVDTDSNAGSATAPLIVGNYAMTSQEDVLTNKTGGPVIIVGDTVITWSDGNTIFSTGDYTVDNGLIRAMSWNWASLLTGSNTKSASYAPVFVDAAITNSYLLALDSKGKIWGMGSQLNGTGLAKTTTTGLTRPVDILPYYGFAPVPFFQSASNSNVIIRKIYVPNYQASAANACSAALSQTGDLFVTGANNFGNLGTGNTTIQYNWVKYSVSNVKDVKVSNNNMFVLTNDNKLYMSGYDPYSIGGTNANKTTPLFLASNVSTFEFGHQQGLGLYVVKNDATLWTAGYNNSGQLGLGNLANQVGLTQVAGVSNAKLVVASKDDGSTACLLRTDRSISFVGNDLYGEMGYSGHTAATTEKVFVTPIGAFQGIVKKVALGIRSSVILTMTGAMYNAGQLQWRGQGTIDNSWKNRLFTQIPLPEAAAGFRMMSDTVYDGVYILTSKARMYGYGSVVASSHTVGMSSVYSPTLIPLRPFDYGIAITPAPADLTQLKATFKTVSAGIATTSFNKNTNTVTFKIPYTGTIGTIDSSTWSISGTGVTVTGIQKPIYVSYTSGQISFTATVTSSDTGIDVGSNVPQLYTVNMGTNGTSTVTGTRVNDFIAASLSTNTGNYVGANIGDWVEVGSNEYFTIKSNISMSNTLVAGATESVMGATTTTLYAGAVTIGNFGSTSFGKIAESNYPYAISFVPSTTQASASYQLKSSEFAYLGYTNIGSIINTPTTLNVRKYFVLRGASTMTPSTSFVGYYASVANMKGLTVGTSTYSTGNVARVATASTSGTPSFQVLTSATKVWA